MVDNVAVAHKDHIQKLLQKKIPSNEMHKVAKSNRLGRQGMRMVTRCICCKTIISHLTNISKHLRIHSAERRRAMVVARRARGDVVASLRPKLKALPTPAFWNHSSIPPGLKHRINLHFGSQFIPFEMVTNETYRLFLEPFPGSIRTPAQFRNTVIKMADQFVESIKEVFKETDMISIMIDGRTDKSSRKYLGVMASFVPNLDKLQTLSADTVNTLTRNNQGELQCTLFLALMSETDLSENSNNLEKWILEVVDKYEIRDKIFAINSDKASVNVKVVEKLRTSLKETSPLIKRTDQVFFLNCTAHLENRLVMKLLEGLKNLKIGWPRKISELSCMLRDSHALSERWKKKFNFKLPRKNSTRWFSEFRLYHQFLRAAPKPQEFTEECKDLITRDKLYLFSYSKEDIEEIIFLLCIVAPFNHLFFQLKKDSVNSVMFGLYYYHLTNEYMTDINLMRSSGRSRGKLGDALKSFVRYGNMENFNASQTQILSIFENVQKLFVDQYGEQKLHMVHFLTDLLNPYSKLGISKRLQSPDERPICNRQLIEFFNNYLDTTPYSPSVMEVVIRASSRSGDDAIDALDTVTSLMSSNLVNEYQRYRLDPEHPPSPNSMEEIAKGVYHFWINRRHVYPKLSKLAL